MDLLEQLGGLTRKQKAYTLQVTFQVPQVHFKLHEPLGGLVGERRAARRVLNRARRGLAHVQREDEGLQRLAARSLQRVAGSL